MEFIILNDNVQIICVIADCIITNKLIMRAGFENISKYLIHINSLNCNYPLAAKYLSKEFINFTCSKVIIVVYNNCLIACITFGIIGLVCRQHNA